MSGTKENNLPAWHDPLLFVFQSDGMEVWCGPEGSHFRTCIRKPL
jgi:hypothetical protein